MQISYKKSHHHQKISPIFYILLMMSIILIAYGFLEQQFTQPTIFHQQEDVFIQKTKIPEIETISIKKFLIKDSQGLLSQSFKNYLEDKADFKINLENKNTLKTYLSQFSYNNQDYYNAIFFENEDLDFQIYKKYSNLQNFIIPHDFDGHLNPQQYWQFIKILEYDIYQNKFLPKFYKYLEKNKKDPQIILSNFTSEQIAVINYYVYKNNTSNDFFAEMVHFADSKKTLQDKINFTKIFNKNGLTKQQNMNASVMFLNKQIFGYLIQKDIAPLNKDHIIARLEQKYHDDKKIKKLEKTIQPKIKEDSPVPSSYIMGI